MLRTLKENPRGVNYGVWGGPESEKRESEWRWLLLFGTTFRRCSEILMLGYIISPAARAVFTAIEILTP